jgi:hypothetical protein
VTDLAIVAGVLVAMVCLSLVIWHSSIARRFTFLDWSVTAIGGVYGLGWALVVLVTRGGDNPRWEGFLLPNKAYFLIHSACVVVLVGGLFAGWLVSAGRSSVAHETVPAERLRTVPYSWEFPAACLMLLLAAFTQWLYTLGYGGFLGALTSAAAFRSGLLVTSNPWGFLFPFGPLALVASFMLYGLLLVNPRRISLWVPFVFSLGVSMYVLLLRLGRVDALVFVATFVFGYLLFRARQPLTLLWVSAVGGAGILAGSYWLSFASGISFTDGLQNFLARELAFPFVTFLEHAASSPDFRWFYDIVVIPIFFLPESLWTGTIENVSDVTTALIKGAPKGLAGVSGGMPVDLITLGLLQASVAGVFVVGFLFGGLLRVLDRLTARIDHPGIRSVVSAHLAFKIAVLGIFYAQPVLLVKGNMYLIAAGLLYWFCRAMFGSTQRPLAVSR